MSMRLMAQAMSIKVGNPLRKLVLIKLADNANDDGICFPSYQYIADVCEISRRSAMNHIEALIDMGFVLKKSRKNKDGSSSNLYVLNLEKGSAGDSLGSAGYSLGGSAGDSPITYHSLEPINEPIKKTKQKSAVVLLAEFGIEGQLAEDFIAHRKSKKATITETVLKGYQREADKAGIPLAAAMEISIVRNWQGFNANWDWKGTATHSKYRPNSTEFADDGTWANGMVINVDLPEELLQ